MKDMMRLAAYAGTSVVLAAGVVLNAFRERPNFYSAAVYLSQSNACLMILTNFILICSFFFLYGLQRLFYGPLRPIEVEQIYERSWFAVTETCLAMTIFRDEIGAWFLVMFTGLLFSKVWGWIGDGRLEFLEQQPPVNPRLFHARLAASLLMSVAFNGYMVHYSITTVLEQVRPGMMVMFAFEFMILLILSISTLIRYGISLTEIAIVKKKTRQKLEERRAEVRAARAAAEREAADGEDSERRLRDLPREEDIDENEIDVPGWEEKGRSIFILDLATDAAKLIAYMFFFVVIMFFHGLPIHIIRDVYLTLHSFIKRIHDFVKYRNATRDMDARYPNASVEELGRENTCIICREDMRLQTSEPEENAGGAAGGQTVDDRMRPKKLPCGHILHLGCLKSWLERQQVCPTCRRPVLIDPPPGNSTGGGDRGEHQLDGEGGNHRQNRLHELNLGRINIRFGLVRENQLGNIMPQGQQNPPARAPAQGPNSRQTQSSRTSQYPLTTAILANAEEQLRLAELRTMRRIRALNLTQQQLATVHALQGELARLRIAHAHERVDQNNNIPDTNQPNNAGGHPQIASPFVRPPDQPGPLQWSFAQPGQIFPTQHVQFPQGFPQWPQPQQAQTVWAPNQNGQNEIPAGVTVPPGWTLLPLQRIDNTNATQAGQSGQATPQQPFTTADAVRSTQPATASPGSGPTFASNPVPDQPTRRTMNATGSQSGSTHVASAHQCGDQGVGLAASRADAAGTRMNGNHQSSSSEMASADTPPSDLERSSAAAVNEPSWGFIQTAEGQHSGEGSNKTDAAPNSHSAEQVIPSTVEVNESAAATSSNKGKGKAASVEDVQESENA